MTNPVSQPEAGGQLGQLLCHRVGHEPAPDAGHPLQDGEGGEDRLLEPIRLPAAEWHPNLQARDKFGRRLEVNPTRSEWELLDFGDVVAHVMTPQQREFFDLESFYATAEEVVLEDHMEAA